MIQKRITTLGSAMPRSVWAWWSGARRKMRRPSRIPTFSFKRLAITQRWVLPAMVIITVFVALLASETWNTILGCGVAYLASIPFSYRQYQRLAMQRPHAPTIDQRAEHDQGQDRGAH